MLREELAKLQRARLLTDIQCREVTRYFSLEILSSRLFQAVENMSA